MDEFETWWESPSGAYDRQHKFLAKAAWEAGREQGMREAAELIGAEAARLGRLGSEHPADSPSRDRCFARARTAEYIRDAILAAIEGEK